MRHLQLLCCDSVYTDLGSENTDEHKADLVMLLFWVRSCFLYDTSIYQKARKLLGGAILFIFQHKQTVVKVRSHKIKRIENIGLSLAN